MQQLYLTGNGASASAAQLMNALNVPFSGFRLTPVHLGGSLRGEALHLLLPPPKPPKKPSKMSPRSPMSKPLKSP